MSTRGGTTLMRRVNQVAPRADHREGTAVVRRPLRSAPPAPAAKREPRESFDLGAWVHGVLDRPEETPSEPFEQGVVRKDRPAPQPRTEAHAKPTRAPDPERSLDNQGLARWAFGLVAQAEEVAPAPRVAQRPSAKRKALTMPDLFHGGAVPPCLQDD